MVRNIIISEDNEECHYAHLLLDHLRWRRYG